jgi:hypothetical protein
MAFSIYSIYQWLQPGFRQCRWALFLDIFHPDASTRILDVGGHVYDWEGIVPIASQITLLNLAYPKATVPAPARFTSVIGDGRRLPFPDGSFDIVYSNSVIEHVGNRADQERFAAEIRRVARGVFLQTPNRWFFIEPHFIAPFVHYLPPRLAQRLLRVFSVRAWLRRGDDVELAQLDRELRLLTASEMRTLFPDCILHRERWCGLTKSFVMVRR